MSYGMAGALQAAVYQHLLADAALGTLVGAAIYDALPPGDLPQTYVSLGPEEVRQASDGTGGGAQHRFTVSVVTAEPGFGAAKAAAAAVADALDGADLALSRGRLVGMWFDRAVTRRTGGAARLRRVDLRFRARVEDG